LTAKQSYSISQQKCFFLAQAEYSQFNNDKKKPKLVQNWAFVFLSQFFGV